MRTRSTCIVLFFILPLLFMTGCSKHYKTDFLNKFDSYLEYSLGDFEVIVNKEKIEWRGDPLPVSGTGLRWVVAYTDDGGSQREFEFLNYGYTEGGDASNFGYAVMEYAMNLGRERITQDVLLQYFQPDEIGVPEDETNEPETSVLLIFEYPPKGDDEYARFVDPRQGLQLKSLHPKQLIHEWGASYNFKFRTSLIDDEDQAKQFIAKIEQVLRDYMKYVDSDDLLPIEIHDKDYEDGYRGTYDKKTDSFTWITKKEYEKSLDYIDGKLKELNKVILNGKEYIVGETYADEKVYYLAATITYCQDTQQYHIRDFEDLLTLLGIQVSNLDKGNTFEWTIGSDTYTVNKLGGWTLTKNGGANLLQYNAHECKGISQSDFEMISNTTVSVDQENGALIVNSH